MTAVNKLLLVQIFVVFRGLNLTQDTIPHLLLCTIIVLPTFTAMYLT